MPMFHDTKQFLTDLSHFILAGLYCFVAILTVYMRIGQKVSSSKWIWQRTFAVLLLLGIASTSSSTKQISLTPYCSLLLSNVFQLRSNAMEHVVRFGYFFMQPLVSAEELRVPNALNFTLGTFPAFLFLSCYMLILFLWAEVFHDIGVSDAWKLKVVYFGFNGALYSTVILLFIVDGATEKPGFVPIDRVPKLEAAVLAIDATLYIVTALAYLVYGIGLYFKFRSKKNPLIAKIRETVWPKVKYFTVLCSLAFLARGALTWWGVFMNWSANLWWIDIAYYGGLEVISIVLMLLILHRKEKSSYNPAAEESINENPYFSDFRSDSENAN